MIRAWVNPIFNTVPREIRYSGMLPMIFYAAINPSSWIKPPYYGLMTFIVVWWWVWKNNLWNTIRYEGETWDRDKYFWLLRTSLWSFFLNPIVVGVVYALILIFVWLTSMQLRITN